MSTIISPAFTFVEWKRFVCNEKPQNTWSPDVHTSTQIPESWPHQEPIAKWIYVFAEQGTTNARWTGEYFFKDRLIFPVDLTACRGLERDRRPHAEDGVSAISLPYEVNGLRITYFAYVSRVQLPLKFVKELEERARHLLLHVDLADVPICYDYAHHHQLFALKNQWCYRAVDPLTVALNLSAEYRDACDDLIGYTTGYAEQPEAQKERVTERVRKRVISDALITLLDADESDALDLRAQFAPGGEIAMRNFNTDFEKQTDSRARERDRRAAQICFWLSGDLMDFAQRVHLAADADVPAFLNVMGVVMSRLQESTPGKHLLARWVCDDSHWLHVYVVPPSPADGNKFSSTRKAGSAVTAMWGELLGTFLSLYNSQEAAAKLVLGWKNITRIDEMRVEVELVNGRVLNYYRDVVDVKITNVTIRADGIDYGRFRAWMATDEVDTISRAFASFSGAIEIANVGLSLKALREAGIVPNDWDSALALLGLAGSTIDFGLTFASIAFKESWKKSVIVVGGISAVIDIICAGFAAEDAAQMHDYSTMIGQAALMAAGLIALGTLCMGSGAAESATGVGIPIGVLSILVGGFFAVGGMLLITLGEESDIALFTAHSVWGVAYGGYLGYAYKPWSEGPFREWYGRLDIQVAALVNILCSFTLEAYNIGWLRVFYGNVTAGSRFEITFECRTAAGVHRPQCAVKMGTRELTHVDGDPILIDNLHFRFTEIDGRQCFEILPRWPYDREPRGWGHCTDIKCTVLLDANGDGSNWIPRTGPVPFTIVDPRWGLNGSPESSVDYEE